MRKHELNLRALDVIEVLNEANAEQRRMISMWDAPIRASWDLLFLRAAYDTIVYDLLCMMQAWKDPTEDEGFMEAVGMFTSRVFYFYVTTTKFSPSVISYVGRWYLHIYNEYCKRYALTADDNLSKAMKYALDNTTWEVDPEAKCSPATIFKDVEKSPKDILGTSDD